MHKEPLSEEELASGHTRLMQLRELAVALFEVVREV